MDRRVVTYVCDSHFETDREIDDCIYFDYEEREGPKRATYVKIFSPEAKYSAVSIGEGVKKVEIVGDFTDVKGMSYPPCMTEFVITMRGAKPNWGMVPRGLVKKLIISLETETTDGLQNFLRSVDYAMLETLVIRGGVGKQRDDVITLPKAAAPWKDMTLLGRALLPATNQVVMQKAWRYSKLGDKQFIINGPLVMLKSSAGLSDGHFDPLYE